MRTIDTVLFDLDDTLHDDTTAWLAALRAVGIDDGALARTAADEYVRARSGELILAPGSLDVLTALRARGCKLGLVTNGFAATHHDKIDRLGLREHMDGFFLADE